jgi:hypothetical protein
LNVCFSASPSSPSITSCTPNLPNLPNPYLPPTDATGMFDLVYPTIQRNKSSTISGQDESDREWFFRSAGSGFLPFFFWIRDLMWFSLSYSFAPPPMVSHDPAVSISPMDSTHPSLPLYIARTSHVIPSPLTTMSVFRLGSCSSLPASSSADTTFSRFLPQYLATSDCIKRRWRFGQPWLERECPSASSRPGRWIEL